jgi:hypothetical protein
MVKNPKITKRLRRKGCKKHTHGKGKTGFEDTRGVSPKSGPKLNKKKRIVVGGVNPNGFIQTLIDNGNFDVSQYVLSDVYKMVNDINNDDKKLISLLKTRVYFETDRGFKWILSVLLPAYLKINDLPENPLQICNGGCEPSLKESVHINIFNEFIKNVQGEEEEVRPEEYITDVNKFFSNKTPTNNKINDFFKLMDEELKYTKPESSSSPTHQQPDTQLGIIQGGFKILDKNNDHLKKHDLGEIKSYTKKDIYSNNGGDETQLTGIFLCDFGGTDLKVYDFNTDDKVEFKDDEVVKENYKALLISLNEDETDNKVDALCYKIIEKSKIFKISEEKYDEPIKELYIRTGSLLKGNDENITQKRVKIINRFVEKLNEILKDNNSQFTVSSNIVIENSLHDIIGRISKVEFSNLEENFFVIGGPLSYISDKKFIGDVDLSNIGKYTFEKVDDLFTNKLAHLEQKKIDDRKKQIYYFNCLKHFVSQNISTINDKKNIILLGPTGSNPTISLYNKNKKEIITSYEYDNISSDYNRFSDNPTIQKKFPPQNETLEE